MIIPSTVVYIASPVSTFQTARYEVNLIRIRRRYSEAEILEPRRLFKSTADWRAKWSSTLEHITELVFFCDESDHYGDGLAFELEDARLRHIPVWYLAPGGLFYPNSLVVHEPGRENPGQSWTVRFSIAAAGYAADFCAALSEEESWRLYEEECEICRAEGCLTLECSCGYGEE